MFGLFTRKGEGPDYASFERRMLASVIDTLFLGFLIAPILTYIWNPAAEMQGVVRQIMMDYRTGNLSAQQFNEAMINYLVYGGGLLLYFKDTGFQLLVFGVIIVAFWIYKRGTPGKILLRMEIVDAKTLGQPSKTQYIMRYLGYFVATLPVMLGFLWILFDKKRRGFHDLMAGTVVIVKPRKKKETA